MSEINLIESLHMGYKEDFIVSPHIIGNSALPFGLRSNIIKSQNNLTVEPNMKMLSGSMTHRSFQKKRVMYQMTKNINKIELGYIEVEINGYRFIELDNGKYQEFTAQKEKALFVEITKGRYLRMHIDICVDPLYCIEMKFTTKPKSMWGDLAPYHAMQLNTYLGFMHHKFGYVLKGDLAFYKSASKRWSYVWNKYFALIPYDFRQDLFDYTINKTKEYFGYINNNTELGKIKCPEFLFECSDKCKDYCPNPIEKVKIDVNETCFHCRQPVEMGTTGIIRNDNTYHYTNEKGHPFEKCRDACLKAWEVKENE